LKLCDWVVQNNQFIPQILFAVKVMVTMTHMFLFRGPEDSNETINTDFELTARVQIMNDGVCFTEHEEHEVA
jgi:hypothetical protein